MSPSPNLLERVRGKRMRDIELPNTTDRIDPRIEDAMIERDSRSLNPLKRIRGAMRKGQRQMKRVGRR